MKILDPRQLAAFAKTSILLHCLNQKTQIQSMAARTYGCTTWEESSGALPSRVPWTESRASCVGVRGSTLRLPPAFEDIVYLEN